VCLHVGRSRKVSPNSNRKCGYKHTAESEPFTEGL